tara:strand:- start:2562 stop:2834 length:273 start_codon:yes stop_codon:yes gene_type:complete
MDVEEVNLDMSSQNYLEAMDQLNKKFKEVEDIQKKATEKKDELVKEILTIYGVVRILDNLVNNSFECPHEVQVLTDVLRGHISSIYDELI